VTKILVPIAMLLLALLGVPPVYADSCSAAAALNASTPKAPDADSHYMFVADTVNNRVLVFTLDANKKVSGNTPRYVLGQPDFDHCAAGTSRSAMSHPSALAVDSAGKRLFVADEQNNRVLVFSTADLRNGLPAANVLGQVDFTSRAVAATLSGMDRPRGVAFDPGHNRLFVVAANVNAGNDTRVLLFDASHISDGMSAAGILGPPDAVLQLPGRPTKPAPGERDSPPVPYGTSPSF